MTTSPIGKKNQQQVWNIVLQEQLIVNDQSMKLGISYVAYIYFGIKFSLVSYIKNDNKSFRKARNQHIKRKSGHSLNQDEELR
ncbi:unnamed protein product [Paramecium octaurelia]|uniref:Uncharacterized protein n=1 Tax=Paramecium octaurelia TaxID=43137 RepID=A0A8S1W929_PAROT|nr:unnamed protein product [Paramecium octaurelia]